MIGMVAQCTRLPRTSPKRKKQGLLSFFSPHLFVSMWLRSCPFFLKLPPQLPFFLISFPFFLLFPCLLPPPSISFSSSSWPVEKTTERAGQRTSKSAIRFPHHHSQQARRLFSSSLRQCLRSPPLTGKKLRRRRLSPSLSLHPTAYTRAPRGTLLDLLKGGLDSWTRRQTDSRSSRQAGLSTFVSGRHTPTLDLDTGQTKIERSVHTRSEGYRSMWGFCQTGGHTRARRRKAGEEAKPKICPMRKSTHLLKSAKWRERKGMSKKDKKPRQCQGAASSKNKVSPSIHLSLCLSIRLSISLYLSYLSTYLPRSLYLSYLFVSSCLLSCLLQLVFPLCTEEQLRTLPVGVECSQRPVPPRPTAKPPLGTPPPLHAKIRSPFLSLQTTPRAALPLSLPF